MSMYQEDDVEVFQRWVVWTFAGSFILMVIVIICLLWG